MATAVLLNERSGEVKRVVRAKYSVGSELEIEVHDLGEGASLTGDEYECWYTVSATNVPAFCELVGIDAAALIKDLRAKYSGDATQQLLDLMRESKLVRFASHW